MGRRDEFARVRAAIRRAEKVFVAIDGEFTNAIGLYYIRVGKTEAIRLVRQIQMSGADAPYLPPSDPGVCRLAPALGLGGL